MQGLSGSSSVLRGEGGRCQPRGLGKAGSEIPFLEYNYGANRFLCWFSRLSGCILFNGILKHIMSRDVPTVKRDLPSEGHPWHARLSLLQHQQSPRAADHLPAQAAMAKSRGAGQTCPCARSWKRRAGRTLGFMGPGGKLCWEQRHIQERR